MPTKLELRFVRLVEAVDKELRAAGGTPTVNQLLKGVADRMEHDPKMNKLIEKMGGFSIVLDKTTNALKFELGVLKHKGKTKH